MVGIKDVAARAGVSPATASRALNGHLHISPAKRAAVLQAAEALGYRPDAVSTAVPRKRDKTVGVLLARQGSPFGATLHRAIEATLAAEGYLAMVCSTHTEPERENAYVRRLLDIELGGVIIRPSSSLALAARNAARFERAGVPVVFVETAPPTRKCSQVTTDNYAGGREAIQHLYDLGHRNIGILVKGWDQRAHGGRPGFMRVSGALDAARDLDIADRIAISSDMPGERFDFGRRAMRQLLIDTRGLTAVFATTDMIGLGAISCLHEEGMDVPRDMSVLSFDGLPLGEMALPALSTMSQRIEMMGQTAARLLIDHMTGRMKRPCQIVLQPRLTLRESVAPHSLSRSIQY